MRVTIETDELFVLNFWIFVGFTGSRTFIIVQIVLNLTRKTFRRVKTCQTWIRTL